MKRIILSSFLIAITLNLFAQSDTTQKDKVNIGLGISEFHSVATNFNPSLNISLTAVYKKHSAILGLVFGGKGKVWKGPGSLQASVFNGIELDGASFHYRFALKHQKRFSPVMGYNFNYIKVVVDYSDYESLTNYESLLTFGIQFNFSKNISLIHEIGLGHRYYKHIYPYDYHSLPHEGNGLSASMKISLNYFF